MGYIALIGFLLGAVPLSADYIKNHTFYIVNKKEAFNGEVKRKNYKEYAKILLEEGVYSKEELNKAIKKNTSSGLSAFVRAIAYDRAGDLKNAERFTKMIAKHSEDYTKITSIIPLKLVLADLYLRQNNPEMLKKVLVPNEFLGFKKEYSLEAQYYFGMSNYLKTNKIDNYFLTAKDYFQPAKIIFYKKNNRIKGITNYATKD